MWKCWGGREGEEGEISGGVRVWIVSEIDGLLELKFNLIIQMIILPIFQLIISMS